METIKKVAISESVHEFSSAKNDAGQKQTIILLEKVDAENNGLVIAGDSNELFNLLRSAFQQSEQFATLVMSALMSVATD